MKEQTVTSASLDEGHSEIYHNVFKLNILPEFEMHKSQNYLAAISFELCIVGIPPDQHKSNMEDQNTFFRLSGYCVKHCKDRMYSKDGDGLSDIFFIQNQCRVK